MNVCAKWKYASCAHKIILYKIIDELGKIKQAMHDVIQGLDFTSCLGSKPN